MTHSFHAKTAEKIGCSEQPDSGPSESAVADAIQGLRRERRTDIARLLCAATCGFVAALFLGLVLAASCSHASPHLLHLLLCLVFTIAGFVALPNGRSRALQTLRRQPDVRAVGPLLDALDIALLPSNAQAIHLLLTDLLPRMQPADSALLNDRQRGRLYEALTLNDPARDLPYLLAIVQALEHIGDAESLNQLQRLIQPGAVTLPQHHLRQAAQTCAHALAVRLRQAQVRDTLLRPAARAGHTGDLLHPAMPRAEDQSSALLRPSRRENDAAE